MMVGVMCPVLSLPTLHTHRGISHLIRLWRAAGRTIHVWTYYAFRALASNALSHFDSCFHRQSPPMPTIRATHGNARFGDASFKLCPLGSTVSSDSCRSHGQSLTHGLRVTEVARLLTSMHGIPSALAHTHVWSRAFRLRSIVTWQCVTVVCCYTGFALSNACYMRFSRFDVQVWGSARQIHAVRVVIAFSSHACETSWASWFGIIASCDTNRG